jgi:hypothetical protein
MDGDQADFVAEPEPVGGGRDGEAAVLVRRALVGGGGLVGDERRARIEGQCLEAGVDDRAVLGRAAHHSRLDEEARLEGLGRLAVAGEVAAVIGVHEDVGAALQLGIDAARRLELEALGSANPIEDRKAAGHHVKQILAVGGGLPIFAHRNVGHVLPQLHLQIGTDPPLLVEITGVEPGGPQGLDARAGRPA